MKIIHTGDIHLGSAMRGLSMEKANIRRAELLDGFRRLCVYAKEKGVAAVVIAGDLFDENKASGALRSEVFSIIAKAQPVCFFYVSGNHDDEMYFDGGKPQNLFLFSFNHGWQSYNLNDNITITGIDSKNLSLPKYDELRLRGDRFHIVAMHGDINGREGGVCLSKLQNKNIDYLALGHIHQPMMQSARLDGRGRYRYCGCLEGRGFDELGERGFFLIEIANGRVLEERFISLCKRQIVQRGVDISACKTYYDVERVVLESLNGIPREFIVKICLCGRHAPGLKKDILTLTARIEQLFFHTKVVDESRLFIDYEAFRGDLSERGEFVREVGRYELSEEDRAEILDVGLKALAGEDIDL